MACPNPLSLTEIVCLLVNCGKNFSFGQRFSKDVDSLPPSNGWSNRMGEPMHGDFLTMFCQRLPIQMA